MQLHNIPFQLYLIHAGLPLSLSRLLPFWTKFAALRCDLLDTFVSLRYQNKSCNVQTTLIPTVLSIGIKPYYSLFGSNPLRCSVPRTLESNFVRPFPCPIGHYLGPFKKKLRIIIRLTFFTHSFPSSLAYLMPSIRAILYPPRTKSLHLPLLRATLLAKCGEKFGSLGPYSRLINTDVFFKIGLNHSQFGVNMVRGGVFYFTRFFSLREHVRASWAKVGAKWKMV
jgi:hypothetical protein